MLDNKKIADVTYREIRLMLHAIGYEGYKITGTKYHRFTPHRNYFDAGPADIPYMEHLTEIGLMRKFTAYQGKECWCVSDDGRAFLTLVTGISIMEEID